IMRDTGFYVSNIENYNNELIAVKYKRNIVTIGKVVCFILFICAVYLIIDSDSRVPYYWMGGASVIGFIILSVLDTKIVDKLNGIKSLIKINITEKDYIDGELSDLDTGSEFSDPGHPYSHDLDIFGEDSLFQSLNRTVTLQDKKILAEWLKEPLKDSNEIISRQNAVKDIASKPLWMQEFRSGGMRTEITENETGYVETWVSKPLFYNNRKYIGLLLSVNVIILLVFGTAVLGFISYALPVYLFVFQLLVVMVMFKRINTVNDELDRVSAAIGKYYHLIKVIDREEFHSEKLKNIKENLFYGEAGALYAFRSLNRILNGFDQRKNFLITIILNGVYTRDLHLVNSLDKWKLKYGSQINLWMRSVETVDALISMANFSFNHPEYLYPNPKEGVILSAVSASHPLLRSENKVSNDFELKSLHEIFIVTGANMAGKSTFLRTIGVNMVLAMSGNVVCADIFEFTPVDMFTSMRTTDNLSKGTSYFHAELLRLKALREVAEGSEGVLIILDEMLKGTNSNDKLNGSRRFLEKIIGYPVCGIVATHDLALGQLSREYPDNFHNACFEIDHVESGIVYDYKLKEGVSRNMNASILLEELGLI
ncbi:MAG: hypothetical protein LIO79_09040, partial [Rikenellaceae bacterium]|nr:hypothetical protein [Rikenellaceae bacterium]